MKIARARRIVDAAENLGLEEVVIDFGLDPSPFRPGRQGVSVSRRLVLNFYTARRPLSALALTLRRHEQTFGAVEPDVRRRAGAPPAAAPAPRHP
jgi:hypothetical protein